MSEVTANEIQLTGDGSDESLVAQYATVSSPSAG